MGNESLSYVSNVTQIGNGISFYPADSVTNNSAAAKFSPPRLAPTSADVGPAPSFES